VATTRAKVLDYAAAVDRAGRVSAEGAAVMDLDSAWTPEHLVLAAICRCTLKSLAYHAHRAGIDIVGSASARGRVTRREEDGRYAFVELECSPDVEIDPEPPGEELEALLAKGVRDCFIAASLVTKTSYRWRVNGREVAT
jgi:organic hydroperoxide reductase OsmC/OhrA